MPLNCQRLFAALLPNILPKVPIPTSKLVVEEGNRNREHGKDLGWKPCILKGTRSMWLLLFLSLEATVSAKVLLKYKLTRCKVVGANMIQWEKEEEEAAAAAAAAAAARGGMDKAMENNEVVILSNNMLLENPKLQSSAAAIRVSLLP
jgi:hypothetical protein